MSNEYQALLLVQKEIGKMRQDREEFISSGRAKDYSEYQHVCGVILGLNHADIICKDLVQRINNDD
jgi:hypothetical protein